MPTQMTNHTNRSKTGPSRNPTANEIWRLRELKNLTQDKAAHLIHCSARAWQQWEAGERRMHPAFWELFRLNCRPLIRPQLKAQVAAQYQ